MIDKRLFKPVKVFSIGLCSAIAVKLVLFTEYKTPLGLPQQDHCFSALQRYTQAQLDKFFKVDDLGKTTKE
ncbi:hypothetical protein SDRG_05044 [Saprolegnia diclina VS20]|uniref:Uncharacterized protein n=1 Tax=Saprolegnia diclina (strain VS20) TaxID=1156394 RepID=T0QRX5_SAPDV|nr:hypothetical protein SDRG_05044 [Saprolegnia diclina VS20]EQC37441.1 hypothetical protein SDRG_05044 [Saprolegnia diclina VS20]|eukprot:XP_008608961.1 hypothetical protein SDRG_05044 [Saprolegnia diclina VS20]